MRETDSGWFAVRSSLPFPAESAGETILVLLVKPLCIGGLSEQIALSVKGMYYI